MIIPKDITNWIQQAFPKMQSDATQIIEIVLQDQPENERTARCIIFLAEGDLQILRTMAKVAKEDYRDVIFWAEYTNHEKRPQLVRNFNLPVDLDKIEQPNNDIRTIVHSIANK